MEVVVCINLEVGDESTLDDIIKILEMMIPYIADNVVVSYQTTHSTQSEEENVESV